MRKLVGNLARRFWKDWKHLRKFRLSSIKKLICCLFVRVKTNDSHTRDKVRKELGKTVDVFRKSGLISGQFVSAEMTSGSFRAEGVSARIEKQPSWRTKTCLF